MTVKQTHLIPAPKSSTFTAFSMMDRDNKKQWNDYRINVQKKYHNIWMEKPIIHYCTNKINCSSSDNF
jgi:hypothetical protein